MRYDTAIYILKDLPKHWSNDSKSIRPEYAKQLLENKLIEEVEPGKYRTTQDGTYYSHQDMREQVHSTQEMRDNVNFTVEEIDLEPWGYRLGILYAKRHGLPFDEDTINKKALGCIGTRAPG